MNSKFKLTNSSDHLNLDLGCPWIHELSDVKDKRSSEYRIYIESSVEAQKLVPSSDGETRLSSSTETILVEPHHFTLVSTPLTKEFLAFEERQKAREAAKADKERDKEDATSIKEEILTNPEVEPENSKLPSSKPIRRRKSLEKTPKPKPNTYSKQSATTPVSKQSLPVTPSHKTTTPTSISPHKSPQLLTIPKLPTHPLPPTSSMMSCVSTPPPLPALARIPKQYAGARTSPLSFSTPITSTISPSNPQISSPPPILSSPPSLSSPPPLLSPPTPATPRDTSNDLRPIQVPMPGPNGTQILQTINVPRSVLATASDKPILLTVTPKNGINKGMKQVLVLTKTQPGQSKGPPMFNFSLGQQTSPGNVTLSPRSSLAITPPRLPTEPLPPSIKDLQHPLPRQPAPTPLLTSPSLPSPGAQISPGAARAPVVRTVAPSSVASPVIVTRALTTSRPGSVVLSSRSQDGQTVNTAARQVMSQATTGARVGQVGQIMQTVPVNNQDSRLVVPAPLRGRLVSGQAAGQGLVVGQRVVQGQRVVAGQRIMTAGGQSMVVSGSGQTMVLPAGARQVMAGGVRQVVQGGQVVQGVTRQVGQVVRQVVPGRQVIVSSASQVGGNSSPQFIRVVSSRAGGQPMVVRQAVPGAVANGAQTLAYRDPNTGVVHNNRVRVVSQGGDLGQVRVVQQVQGGQRLVQASSGAQHQQQRTPVEVAASSEQDKPNAPLSRILNALHNRGLVTQHNGKFYYVGDKGKQAGGGGGGKVGAVQAGGVVRVQGAPGVVQSVAQGGQSVVQSVMASSNVVQTVQSQGQSTQFQTVQVSASSVPSTPSTPPKVIPPPPVNSFEGQFASFVSKREVPSSQSAVANGQTHKLVTLRGMGAASNIPVSQQSELVDLTGATSELTEEGLLQGTKRLAANVTEIGPMQEKRIKTIPSSTNDFVYYR